MIISAGELFNKEVICSQNGERLGYVGELEINTESGRIETLIIPGKVHFFGLLGKDDDIIIPFSSIDVFGSEVMLAGFENKHCPSKKKNRLKP